MGPHYASQCGLRPLISAGITGMYCMSSSILISFQIRRKIEDNLFWILLIFISNTVEIYNLKILFIEEEHTKAKGNSSKNPLHKTEVSLL
jgi:hypothetical protein